MNKTSRLPKRRWWVILLKAAAFLIAALLSLVALAIAWFYFQGRSDWARTKAELESRGEKLSFTALLPSPLPDSQNFFADPMWRELDDLVEVEREGFKAKEIRLPKWQRQLDALNRQLSNAETAKLFGEFPEFASPRNDTAVTSLVYRVLPTADAPLPPGDRRKAEFILAVLAHSEPALSQLDQLADRPGASSFLKDPSEMTGWIESSNYLMGYTQILRARIWAEISLGNIPAASIDTQRLLQVVQAPAGNPLLVSFLFEVALGRVALDPIDYGLKAHVWTASDLQQLERQLARLDFVIAFSATLRCERGFVNQSFETSQNLQAGSISYETIFGPEMQARRNRMFQGWIDNLDNYSSTGLNKESLLLREVEAIKSNPIKRVIYLPLTLMPNLPATLTAVAQLQNHVQNTRTACALERYRLKHGHYPSTLQEMVPEILPDLPKDVITLQPMQYRLESPEKFILWSPGWDGTGKNSLPPDPAWTWQSAAK